MLRAAIRRSTSNTTSSLCARACSRRLSSLPLRRHRIVTNHLHRRSLLRQHLKLIPTAKPPPLNAHFRPLSIATSAPHSSPVLDLYDAPEKLGFEKVSKQFIEECKSKAVLFTHKKTGVQIMSLSNDDENKFFDIVFRSPPKDSTGIAHILEHSVLCGSRKYPLKDPFVELLKGSLHTYLNAFTDRYRTCYPVASTNAKDFYNLVDLYLDAVFFPKCVRTFRLFNKRVGIMS